MQNYSLPVTARQKGSSVSVDITAPTFADKKIPPDENSKLPGRINDKVKRNNYEYFSFI
jgi:hypothetical protein